MNSSKHTRTAVVTGASSGIGYGIAEAFLKQGANVVMNARNETKRVAVQIITGDHQRKPIGNRSFFGKIYREIRAKADMRTELRFRDLRRTAITEAESEGVPSEPLSGHRPGSPVKKHYVVFDKDAARRTQQARIRRKVEKSGEKS